MSDSYEHELFRPWTRASQLLRNDRCQNILYKAIFEHFDQIKKIAALVLASKSFQNSSFGANFLLNFAVDQYSIRFLHSVLSPALCFSVQFVPSLHIKQSWANRKVIAFVADAGLQHVSNLVSITSLDLSYCNKITDVGIEHISKLSGISSLNLSHSYQITDVGLAHIAKLSGIKHLDLESCDKITDVGLDEISKLCGITTLNLRQCRWITDAGINHISKLSNITFLNLSLCNKISDEGKTKLQIALPNCNICGLSPR